MGTEVQERIDERQWLTAAQAANRGGLSLWSLYQLAKSGALPAFKPGGRGTYRFRREDVDALMVRVERT